MAHLDNLIDSVNDLALREALRGEVQKVLNSRQFGLVFNPHKPESIALPGFTVRRGDKVRVVQDDGSDRTQFEDTGIWIVSRIHDAHATIRSKSDPDQHREVEVSRLSVVREFGDPIFPGLKSTGSIERAPGKPWHTLINSENFHALQTLLYPHEGNVDAIYIDPPYNTGARDWKYNNRYVDDNDPYRHSKWLSMMERRLRLARRLLKPRDSVLIVTIDEKEVHRLGLLLQQVLPDFQIQMATIVNNPKGVAQGYLSRVEEYAFFCFAPDTTLGPMEDDLLTKRDDELDSEGIARPRWKGLLRSGDDARRQDRERMFYPVWIDPARGAVVRTGNFLPLDQDPDLDLKAGGLHAVWPIRKDGSLGRWGVGPESLQTLIDRGYVALGRYDKKRGTWGLSYLADQAQKQLESGVLAIIAHDPVRNVVDVAYIGAAQRRVKTVWHRTSHDAGAYGTDLIGAFLGKARSFPFPKSLHAVEDALRLVVGHKPHATIVDFFAGSGTTGHAVARLNAQDGGHRRFVLVTNNEVSPKEAANLRSEGHTPGDPAWETLGICEHITKPRIRAAITGTRPDGKPVEGSYRFGGEGSMADGLDENVEFFDLTYEDPALISLGRRFAAIAPLLWMKAGAQGTRIDEIDPSGWSLPDDGVYGVLFDTSRWSDFVRTVNARHNAGSPLNHVFVITDSHSEYQQIVSHLDSRLQTTRLYADYLRTFEINTTEA